MKRTHKGPCGTVLAKNMRQLRVRKLTQEALAYDCRIKRENVARIAKGLRVEPWSLLKDD